MAHQVFLHKQTSESILKSLVSFSCCFREDSMWVRMYVQAHSYLEAYLMYCGNYQKGLLLEFITSTNVLQKLYFV